MHIYNMHEAKTHLSKLVDLVIHGDEVFIAMYGKPVAKLVAINDKPVRRFGLLKGKITIADDFDKPLPEELISDFES